MGLWTNKPVVGNLARIQYSHAQSIDPRNNALNDPVNLRDYDRLLARRQHISSADTDLNSWPNPNIINFPATFLQNLNDYYEHDLISLSQWQALTNDLTNGSTNVNQIINVCFGIGSRLIVDLANANTLHLLMTEKVGNFSVQWVYEYSPAPTIKNYYWWPSIDPDGNGNLTDSDFGSSGMSSNTFGFYFNTASPSSPVTNWFSPNVAQGVYYPGSPGNLVTEKPAFPQAMKFTFTLYDSRGVFKDGQTFTHIVYIGD
jgi:hypothetical protein